MDALAIIGGGSTLASLGVIVYLVVKLIVYADDRIAARDLLDETREELSKVRGELDVETAAHKATSEQLGKEQKLRAATEAQRNDAYREARDHYVERIKSSGVADAQRLIADLLAAPLPGLPPAVPEARDAAADRDGLIDPFVP